MYEVIAAGSGRGRGAIGGREFLHMSGNGLIVWSCVCMTRVESYIGLQGFPARVCDAALEAYPPKLTLHSPGQF